jgi:adenylate cyclase
MHWLSKHRRWMLAAICALCTGLVILASLVRNIPFVNSIWSNETTFRDSLARKARHTRVHEDFVFLGIDEASKKLDQVSPEEVESTPALKAMSQGYPWSREVHAELVERLCNSGARLILFDMIFDRDRPGDEAFAAALARHRDRVVLGANIANGGNASTGAAEFMLVPPNKNLIPGQLEDDRVGYVNYWPDGDRRVRSVNYTVTDGQLVRLFDGLDPGPAPSWEVPHESFDARALRKLGRADRIPPGSSSKTLRFGPEEAYQARSIFQIFVPAMWESNYGGGKFFKDKIVLVGAASPVDHDVLPTTLGDETPGPLLHFHSIAAALDGEFLREIPWSMNFVLLIGAGLAAWLVVTFVRQTMFALLLLATLSAGYLAAAVYSYNFGALFILTLPVVGAFNLSGLFSLGYDFTLERLEKLRTRKTLERYVSKNLVKEILENPDSYYGSLLGVRIPVTILFSDIVGFTGMTEKADPEALVKQLNEYLSRMTAAVFDSGGTLDKFIGDAVMAVWGNVKSRGLAEDAKAAARAALIMRHELRKLNEKWTAEGTKPFAIGIGLNQGEVVGGNIGSQEKMDPTVIGDAVNLASRLESLTRTYAVDILVGPTCSDLVRDEFHVRSVARVQVKGKTEPVEISTLIGARKDAIDPELLRWLETYEAGFAKFRERQFTEAKILFSQFLEFYPDDFLAKMYLERALEYEAQPPDAAWNAVEVFKKK